MKCVYKAAGWAIIIASLLTVYLFGRGVVEMLTVEVGNVGPPMTQETKNVGAAMMAIPLLMVGIIWTQMYLLYKFANKIVEDDPTEGVTPE